VPETAAARGERIDVLVAALRASHIGALITDAAGLVEYVNGAFCACTGLTAEELLGISGDLLFGADNGAQAAEIGRALAAGQAWQGVVVQSHRSGHRFHASVEITPIALPQGGVIGYLALVHDLRGVDPDPAPARAAAFDRLTGLPGETVFDQVLRESLERARLARHGLGIARIDIDRFRLLSESLGSQGADKLLVEVARRLQASIRHEDILAHLQGDRFALLLADQEAPTELLERVLAALRRPMHINGHALVVTASIGTAACPADGVTADELLESADAAVAQAKRLGRDCICHANASHGGGRGFSGREMLVGLQRALAGHEFVLHYQPQLSLSSGEIVGVEALLRWEHPERGLIAPGEFIPLAEESGLIVPISEWVLKQACGQAVAWRQAGLPPLRVAVNLSARHFRFLDLHETVRSALLHSGLDPSCLELELTESVMMHDVAAAMRTLDALKALGVRLSLDDFGTGYSSLAHLSRFAIDALKIDQSFIHDVTTNTVNAAITSATIAMAHKLGKMVIAEGVETTGQMHFLRRQECDEMQGFLFAPALPAAELAARLARGDRLDMHGERNRTTGDNHLLLVDDEPSILAALRRLLRREGYEIFTAASGTEALELLAREKIQVIVSDQRMPGMSGTDFLSYVKAMYPKTVRIVLSGYADITAVTEAINQGAIYKFFSKPWNDEALKDDLRMAFRHWRTQQEPGGTKSATIVDAT
jgi:diguanylate cyclase (GGDEF)-like protein/PAS domain S-box-containing protein